MKPQRDRDATVTEVKRPQRAWPRQIVEVGSKRADPRGDPQATQKISREMLDDVLRRTKSGTRPASRSHHDGANDDSFMGPRDSAPDVTIVKIDSMDLSVLDPSSPPPGHASETSSPVTPIAVAVSPRSRRLHVTPRLAFIVSLLLVAFVGLAAAIGFLAGRVAVH